MSNDTQQDNCRSSVFEKLPEDLRRAVNVAIIEHCPPNFRAIWMQFELAKFGVSYYSLDRYARRLRDRVNLAEAAGLAAEDDAGLDDAIQKLAARRLFELLLNTDGAELTREIAALASTHRKLARTAFDDRQLAEQSQRARHRLELDREHLRLKAQALEWARMAHTRRLPQDARTFRMACSDDAGNETPAALTEEQGNSEKQTHE